MYKYYHRPGYRSGELLLQFSHIKDKRKFVDSFFDTISIINPRIVKQEDFWMNDEILLSIASDKGDFEISIDTYDLVFILSEDTSIIHVIESLIAANPLFAKEEKEFIP